MRVAVVGCGYVGLISGVGLASLGHQVTGIEISQERLTQIAAGRPPFYEPGLDEQLRSGLDAGTFSVSADLRSARAADVVLLCVQTPPRPDGAIDLQFLEEAARKLAAVFAEDQRRRVVVVRSTVVPGTTDTVVRPYLAAGQGSAYPTGVAANPEFLREGSAVADFSHPDRIVVGTHDAWVADWLTEMYAPLGAPVLRTTPATAELAKYTSNALLATLISFSNEIARLCESTPGVDVRDVLGIVHRDHRLSPTVGEQIISPGILSYLKAGCGFGGSCLPKDLSALISYGRARGHELALLRAVESINQTQPERIRGVIERALGGLTGRPVAVLGVAFKAGTDDLRESPGLKLVDLFLERGAAVTVYDPLVDRNALGRYVERGVRVATGIEDALDGADACVVATDAKEFRVPKALTDGHTEHQPLIFDGRGILQPEEFPNGTYYAVGYGATAARGGNEVF